MDLDSKVKTYFIARELRFDYKLLHEILMLGGLDVSKSFARAILSKKQMDKFKKPLDKATFEGFIKGISQEHNKDFKVVLKAVNERNSEDTLAEYYKSL